MAKKIQLEFDIDNKDVKLVSDNVLTLTEQIRFLKKELQKVDESSPQWEILKNKQNELKDNLDKVNIKSREFFGTLSALPGPVGAFAGSLDNGIDMLKTFTSFSFKDIKGSLTEVVKDFGDVASGIGKATGITKLYTVLNGALANSFKAVGVAEGVAATGAKALAGALTATGVGALVVAIGYLVGKIMEWASSTDEADAANERLNNTLKLQNDLIAKNAKDIENFAKQDVLRAKIAGKTEKEIYDIQVQANKDLLDNRRKANDAAYAELQKFNKKQGDYAKLTEDQRKEMGAKLVENEKKTYDAITDQITSNGTFELEYQNTQAEKARTKKQQETDKKLAANKQYQEKLAADNKTADQTLIDLQRENAALAEKDERKRQDIELQNQKLAEEQKINELKISQEKKNLLLGQIATKYGAKQTDVETKRKEEDKKKEDDRLKEVQEWTDKLKDIEISSISDTQMKAKAERQKGFDETKRDLDKALADKKISQDQYDKAIINATKALNNDLKKIDDDKIKEDQDKRIKKLDDELKFLQIKGEALRAGTKAYYENQQAILDAAEKKELENTELTEAQKTAIQEKYSALRKKLKEEENAANWAVASQTLDAMAKVTGAIASSYDEEAKTSQAAFEKRKKLQKATALMSAASGIIQILTQPSTLPSPFDWIVKGLNAVALGIATGIQIKNIDKQTFEAPGGGGGTTGPNTASLGKNYGDGGMIEGPRHAAGGVMINAEGGEAVMTRGAVTMFGPLLSQLNQAGGGTSFSQGAVGGARPDNAVRENPAASQEPMIMKTYVVTNELTSAAEKQARLKDLSTL